MYLYALRNMIDEMSKRKSRLGLRFTVRTNPLTTAKRSTSDSILILFDYLIYRAINVILKKGTSDPSVIC